MINRVNLDTMFQLLKGSIPHIFILIGLVISMCVFWNNEYTLSLILAYSMFQLWCSEIYRTDEIIIATILGLGFMIGEIIIVKSGAWKYSSTSCMCIPVWLYFAWCHTIIIIFRISNAIGFWILMTKMRNMKEKNDENEFEQRT